MDTRWLWTLPVESGYAASMLEVAERWSLADVLIVVDRLEVRAKERKRQEAAQRGSKR